MYIYKYIYVCVCVCTIGPRRWGSWWERWGRDFSTRTRARYET